MQLRVNWQTDFVGGGGEISNCDVSTVLSVKELKEAQQSRTVESNQSTVEVKIDDK